MAEYAIEVLRKVLGRTGGAKRTLLGGALALAVLGPIATADTRHGPQILTKPSAIAVEARPILSFDRTNAAARRFGVLEFRGGLTLSSTNRHFGGWSGLQVAPDGRGFLAISDVGSWMSGRLDYDGDRLSGISQTRIGPVTALGGRPLRRERDADAEGLTLLSGTLQKGQVLISFERNHRIGLFEIGPDGLSPPLRYLERAPEWSQLRLNRSLEAVTVLPGGPMKGAVLALAENKANREGHHSGWIWRSGVNGKPEPLAVRRIGDFDLTDVAALGDGTLVILERSFAWTSGLKMRMRLIRADGVRPGAVLDGPVLIEADLGYDIDNMEGLAVHTSGGETILTLISDDNFSNFLQRTILLQFALKPERIAAILR